GARAVPRIGYNGQRVVSGAGKVRVLGYVQYIVAIHALQEHRQIKPSIAEVVGKTIDEFWQRVANNRSIITGNQAVTVQVGQNGTAGAYLHFGAALRYLVLALPDAFEYIAIEGANRLSHLEYGRGQPVGQYIGPCLSYQYIISAV